MAAPVSVVDSVSVAVVGANVLLLAPPVDGVASNVPAVAEGRAGRSMPGPVSSSLPDTCAVMCDPDDGLLFCTVIVLVTPPVLVTTTDWRTPSAGSNLGTAASRVKLVGVGVVGKGAVNTCVCIPLGVQRSSRASTWSDGRRRVVGGAEGLRAGDFRGRR